MTARNGIFNYIGVFGAIFAGSMIGDYITTPNVKGVDQLKVSAALIQDFKETNPEAALNSTIETLDAVKTENPTYQSEIAGLEFTVAAVKDRLAAEQDPALKLIAMDSLADTLKTYSKDHYKDPLYLGMAGMCMLISLGAYTMDSMIESRDPAERRIRSIRDSNTDAKHNDIWRNQDTS